MSVTAVPVQQEVIQQHQRDERDCDRNKKRGQPSFSQKLGHGDREQKRQAEWANEIRPGNTETRQQSPFPGIRFIQTPVVDAQKQKQHEKGYKLVRRVGAESIEVRKEQRREPQGKDQEQGVDRRQGSPGIQIDRP